MFFKLVSNHGSKVHKVLMGWREGAQNICCVFSFFKKRVRAGENECERGAYLASALLLSTKKDPKRTKKK